MASSSKPTDCVLFIDELMAKLIIAWQRLRWLDGDDKIDIPEINASYSPRQLADIIGTSTGQIKAMVRQAVTVGIIEMNGEVSDLAQKCVNGIIAKRIQDFK